MDDWNPDLALDYRGPYPRNLLQEARLTLIKCIKDPNPLIVLERVKPKIGISSRCGEAIVPPAPTLTDVKLFSPCHKREVLGYGLSSDKWCYRRDLNWANNSFNFSDLLANKELSYGNNRNQNTRKCLTSSPERSWSGDSFSGDRNCERLKQIPCSADKHGRDQSCSPVDSSAPAFFSGVSQSSSVEKNIQREPRRRTGLPSATISRPTDDTIETLSKDEHQTPSPNTGRTLSPIDKLILNPKAMKIDIPDNLKSVIKNLTNDLSSTSNSLQRNQNTPFTVDNGNDNLNVRQKRRFREDEEEEEDHDHVTKRLKTTGWSDTRSNDNDRWSERSGRTPVGKQANLNNKYSKSMMPSRISVYRGPTILQGGSDILVHPDSMDVFRNTFLLYKCDFCMTTGEAFSEINDHLIATQHFSASLYNARKVDIGVELISIAKMLSVKNTHCKSSRLVVACPDCKDMFEDIFMCALHSKYTHGGINGSYSVCPIVDHQTVKIDTAPICHAENCNTPLFNSHKGLHIHWNRLSDHHPLSSMSRDGEHTFKIIICPYCHLTFRENFIAAKMHVIQNHQKDERNMTALQVKEVLQPRRREELPPLDTSKKGDLGCLLTELEILQNMKNHFDGVSGSKSKIQGIRNRINYLQRMISQRDTSREGY